MAAATVTTSTRRTIRARLPKVRTGCLTCRVRRIKCDEGKPHCLKCVSTGRTCDGYQAHGKRICTKTDSLPRLLLPGTSVVPFSVLDSSPVTLRKKAIKRHIQLGRPLRSLFANEREHRYFRLFCDKVTLQLTGYFESGIWSQLILQASEQDEAIRHAVIAIGALDMVLEEAKISNCVHDSKEISRHHQFALEQYSKAIGRMRSVTADTTPSLRTTLLTCLLIFCFENLHGNFKSALAQVQSGLYLLEDWHQNVVLSSSTPSSLQSGQASKAPNAESSTFGILSPAPSVIEDEILQAFGRLDMQAISWVDHRSVSYYMLAKQCGATSISHMPTRFASITEARIYWELVMRRLMHFICSACVPYTPEPDSPRPSPPSHLSSPSDAHEYSILNLNLDPGRFVSTQTQHAQRIHLSELTRWHAAFTDLYAHNLTQPLSKSYPRALVLQLRFLTAEIALRCCLCRSQTVFDGYLESFQLIVSLAKTLLFTHAETSNSFTFDLGFIAQLYVVGIRCRDRRTRREAIALLLSKPWREGVWDSVLAGGMAGVVMEIEEAGARKMARGGRVSGHGDCGGRHDRGGGNASGNCDGNISAEPYPTWLDPRLRDEGLHAQGGTRCLKTSAAAIWEPISDDDDTDIDIGAMIIPEEARVMGTKVTFKGSANRTATMSCYLRDTTPGAVAGATRIVEKHIWW